MENIKKGNEKRSCKVGLDFLAGPYLRKIIFLQKFLRRTGPLWWKTTRRKYGYPQRGLSIKGPLIRKRALNG